MAPWSHHGSPLVPLATCRLQAPRLGPAAKFVKGLGLCLSGWVPLTLKISPLESRSIHLYGTFTTSSGGKKNQSTPVPRLVHSSSFLAAKNDDFETIASGIRDGCETRSACHLPKICAPNSFRGWAFRYRPPGPFGGWGGRKKAENENKAEGVTSVTQDTRAHTNFCTYVVLTVSKQGTAFHLDVVQEHDGKTTKLQGGGDGRVGHI